MPYCFFKLATVAAEICGFSRISSKKLPGASCRKIKESKDTPSSTNILWRKRSPRYLIRVFYPPLWAL